MRRHRTNHLRQHSLRPDFQTQTRHPSAALEVVGLDIQVQRPRLQTRHPRSDRTFQLSQSITDQTAGSRNTANLRQPQPQTTDLKSGCTPTQTGKPRVKPPRPGSRSLRQEIQAQTAHASSDQTSSDQISQLNPGSLGLTGNSRANLAVSDQTPKHQERTAEFLAKHQTATASDQTSKLRLDMPGQT